MTIPSFLDQDPETFEQSDVDEAGTETHLDVEQVLVDDVDEDDETSDTGDPGDVEEASGEDQGPASSASPKARNGASRAHTRRVAAKVIALIEAPSDAVDLLGSLLGVEASPVELAVAIMHADRSALGVIKDIKDIAASDPFETAILTVQRGRDRMRAMNTVLQAVGASDTATLHASDMKAALSVARSIGLLQAEHVARLDAVVELARKTA